MHSRSLDGVAVPFINSPGMQSWYALQSFWFALFVKKPVPQIYNQVKKIQKNAKSKTR